MPMIRAMRRSKQQLTDEDAWAVLNTGTWGVLAVSGDDGFPYTVPLNYVVHNGAIYFHCAKAGHKLDAILACDKVSFCVVDRDTVVPEEFTSYYRSTVAFGRAHVVEDEAEKQESLIALALRYNPNETAAAEEAAKAGSRMHMVRIDIEHLTGKQAKELVSR